MKIEEPPVIMSTDGVPQGKDVTVYVKKYHDVAELYAGSREDDPVMYEVYTYAPQDEQSPGSLAWGLTVLKPVYTQDECSMTRGHYHADQSCAEIYFCRKGQGLLLLMDEEGHTWAEKMFPGSLHYIDGKYAHRCVNTGDEDLYFNSCWPASAGHDYEAVRRKEFGYRIFRRNGKIVLEKRK